MCYGVLTVIWNSFRCSIRARISLRFCSIAICTRTWCIGEFRSMCEPFGIAWHWSDSADTAIGDRIHIITEACAPFHTSHSVWSRRTPDTSPSMHLCTVKQFRVEWINFDFIADDRTRCITSRVHCSIWLITLDFSFTFY